MTTCITYQNQNIHTHFSKGFVQIHTLNLNGIRLGVAGAISLVEMLANQAGVITILRMVMCSPQKSAKYGDTCIQFVSIMGYGGITIWIFEFDTWWSIADFGCTRFSDKPMCSMDIYIYICIQFYRIYRNNIYIYTYK